MNYPTYIGEQLTALIQTVRRQRNLLFWLRGLAILLAVAAGVLLLVGWAAYKQRFNSGALIGLRIGALVALLATAWLALWRPLRQRVSDAQLARLIEEKTPGLDDSLVSAIEFADDEKRGRTSAAIFERLNTNANQQAQNVNLDAIVPRKRFWQYGGAAFASVALFVSALMFGPKEIREGLSNALTPGIIAATTDKDALKITLKPGNARVPKGTDQKIMATTVNFEAETLTIFTRKAGAGDDQWVGAPMEPARAKNEFQHFIFNIQEDTEYFAEAPGCKSEIYKFTVADLPYVKRIDLAYDFPAYTGMARKVVEDTGEIAALAGTSVRVMAYLTHRAKSARIVLKDGTKIEMQAENTEDGALIMAGTINVMKASSYHIELTSVDGDVYNGSNEYDIVVLEDQPPVVTFEKPGRDTRATSVEEIFSQAKAEDDYGVSSLEMFISVNGGEEKKVELQNLQREAAKSLSGAHTFFLEEYGLQPGDFVSYYAKARDARHETTSDIYFIEIKPFEKDFKQSQQAGGGGGAGGEQQNALSKRQKELIAATFRVIREEERYNEQEKTENYNTITLGQEKLRDDTNQVIERIKRRMGNNLDPNSDFGKLIEYMTQAVKEMEAAIPNLKGKNAKAALPAEQRALQNLLRADAIFREIQVAQQESGQGQGSQRAEELADLFELEMDKKKNQYETIQREQKQQGQQQEDEAKRKLEELARRQQKELEQQQQRAQQGQQQRGGGGGGGGRQQQQMIEEAKKLARELERLSRERRQPELQQLAQKLDQAANDMQKAQAAGNNAQEQLANSMRALEKIEEAKRQMNKLQNGQSSQSVKDLAQRAANAASRQREIQKQTEDLAGKQRSGQQVGQESKAQLGEKKDALANDLTSLGKDIDQAARSTGQEQQGASNKLRQAAGELRGNRVEDRVRATRSMVQQNQFDIANQGDKMIQQNLDQVAQTLDEAQKNAGKPGSSGDKNQDNLDRARKLADNLESLTRRMNNQGQQGQQQGRNQQGQPNGQNQQGQPNGQNQQGQQGQGQGQQQGQQDQGQGQQQGQQGRGQGQQQGQQGRGQGQQQGQQGQGQGQQQGQQGQGQGQQQGQQGQGQGQQQGQQGQGQGQQQGQQGQGQGQQQGQQGRGQGQQQGQGQGQQGQGQGQQQGQGQGQGQQQGQGQGQGQQQGQGGGGQAGGRNQGGGQGQNGQRQPGSPNQQGMPMTGGGGMPRGGERGEERRQTAAELRERLREAEELRRSMTGDREITGQLDQAIQGMREAADAMLRDDIRTAGLLKTQVIDPLRNIENELSKRVQAKLGKNNLRLANEGEAPERYRQLVGEYYKRLSNGLKATP